MSAGRLHLYRFVEDAWAGGLRAWCEAGRDGEIASWIILENAGQERWMARRFADAGITGIRLFYADRLRDEFKQLAGGHAGPTDPATAAFEIESAALQTDNESAIAAARNAATLVDACDRLARAGWQLNQLAFESAAAMKMERSLERSPNFPGLFEPRLRDTLPTILVRMCCVGWGAAQWPNFPLLEIAAAKAVGFEMFVPSPRLPADAQQHEWIEALEQRLGLERSTCPESGFKSLNEALVARLEKSNLSTRSETNPPILLVGREWPDQVRLVLDQVSAWLVENPSPENPIGIVAPEGSPTSVAVAEALVKAGIQVEHPRRPGATDSTTGAFVPLILQQIAHYHLNGQDVGDLLELIRLLWLHGRQAGGAARKWRVLEPEAAQDALDRAFQSAQSRNSRILAQSLPRRKDALWSAIRKLVEIAGRWDAEQKWSAMVEQWKKLISDLGFPAEIPAASPLPSFADQDTISGGAFMEWIAARATAEQEPAPPDYSPAAPVVVTTFSQAAQQTWDHIIFLDSNEHVWPAPIVENPYLPDTTCLRLNSSRKRTARLLTTHDQRAFDQARFLDLLEHCRGPIAFAGVLLEQTDTGDHAQPNEWVLRCLLETGCEGDSFPLDLWCENARAVPPATPSEPDPAELTHLRQVHSSRHNGTMPFDRYQFNFHESKLEPEPWPATGLDDATTCPATFALRELFGAKSTANWSPTRGEGAAVGNRAHRWLGRILGTTDLSGTPEPASSDEAKLARELAAARKELEEWYAAEGLVLPLWWESCLCKTAWATRRCLREIRPWLAGAYCATERSMQVTIRTANGPLKLKGRVDILISDRPEMAGAHVRIFDFKTGRGQAPTLATLEKGDGAQFGAYYLMIRDEGAAEAVIGIIKPEVRASDVFSDEDETNLRARFGYFADLWWDLRFGRRGPLVCEYGVAETLPLATVPIDPAILEQKARLFLLAS